MSDEQATALRAQASTPFATARSTSISQHTAHDQTRSLQVLNETPLRVGTLACELAAGQSSLVVIAKATCTLADSTSAELRTESDPLTGDLDVVPEGSLRYPSDFAAFKARADVVLCGHAHAPRGRAPAALASFTFGSRASQFCRRVAVFGDRHWQRALVSLAPVDPKPFTSMPLVYERAFGGPGFSANPVGAGFKARPGADGIARLPNLEDPDALIRSPGDAPAPACFGPVSPRWRAPERFDESWRKHRWPLFPAAFDWREFQCAPAPQQLPYLRGDEPFECGGMRPDGSMLRGTLPGFRARCFVGWQASSKRDVEEVTMRLDTAVFDLDDMRLSLVWRGAVAVADAVASEVQALLIATEPTGGPRMSERDARQRLRARRS